jgi:O-antigen ligase
MLTCRQFWEAASALRHNKPALAAIGLFLLLAISLLWDVSPMHDATSILLKYRKLLYLPFLLVLFDDAAWRRLAMLALLASLTLVLVLSCTNWLGLTHVGPLYAPTPVQASWVFKHHITQGIFTALLVYLALTLATLPWNPALVSTVRLSTGARVLCAAIVLLALVNLFIMQQGRTGPVLILPLLVLWSWQTFLRGRPMHAGRVAVAVGIAVVVGGAALAYVAHHKSSRMAEIGAEIHDYEKSGEATSMGLRLEFYKRSLRLIAQRPAFGSGVGSVESQFEQMTAGHTGAQGMLTANPHNEYLMMSIQLGVVGLAAFLWLLWQLWRASLRAPGLDGIFSSGYVIAFATACAANSLLLDFPEGHLLIFLCGILLAGVAPTSKTAPDHARQADRHHPDAQRSA